MYARMASGVFLALGFADLAVLNFILAPRLAAGEASVSMGPQAAPNPGPASRAPQTARPSAPAPSTPRPASPAPPPAASAAAPVEAAPDIVFGLGEIRFTSLAAEKDLKRVAGELRADAGKKLVVRGHSDRLGPADNNLVLSRLRAEIVARVLAANGAPLDRVSIEAVGDAEPADTTDTPQGWTRNRRVQLLWR
jgi:outer membrane protein OmpA-like peptidoglycan-associated protein